MSDYGRVCGDALERMQAAWGKRDSFTPDELGGVDSCWEWVSRDGTLFTRRNAEDLTSESLDECFPSLTVFGIELLPGDIVKCTAPLLFADCVDTYVYGCVCRGEWRYIDESIRLD